MNGCSMTSARARFALVLAALCTVSVLARTVSDAEINKIIQADDAAALQQALGAEPGWTTRVLGNGSGEDRGDLLTIAASDGAVRIVSALLAAGADVNGEPAIERRDNTWGHTPLYLACLNNKANVVRTLLAAGADARRADGAGFGPLHVGAALGSLESVQALIESGVSPDMPSQRGDTALELAVMKRRPEIALFLLSRHANPNVENVRGDTALHEAARNGDRQLIAALLDHGARSIKNHYGRTPADEARVWAPDLVDLFGRAPAPAGGKRPDAR